jgi:hypothetical protein
MSDPKRIQSIFQRHVDALARELAQELTQPLADRFGISLTEAVAPVVTAPSTVATAVPLTNASLIYDPRARKWGCPKCRAFSDLRRRAVTTHMRFCTKTALVPPEPPPKVRRKPKKTKK